MKQRREGGLLLPRSAQQQTCRCCRWMGQTNTRPFQPPCCARYAGGVNKQSTDIQRNIISSTHSALHTYKAGEVMENGGLSTALRLLTTCMLTTTATMLWSDTAQLVGDVPQITRHRLSRCRVSTGLRNVSVLNVLSTVARHRNNVAGLCPDLNAHYRLPRVVCPRLPAAFVLHSARVRSLPISDRFCLLVACFHLARLDFRESLYCV